MKPLWKLSFARQLFGSFIIVLVPIVLISLVVNIISMQVLHREITRSSEKSLSILYNRLEDSLKNAENTARALFVSNDINALNQSPDGKGIVWDYIQLYNQLRFLSISDEFNSNITVYLNQKNRIVSSSDGVRKPTDKDRLLMNGPIQHWSFAYSPDLGDVLLISYHQLNHPSTVSVSIEIPLFKIRELLYSLQPEGGTAFLFNPDQDKLLATDSTLVSASDLQSRLMAAKDPTKDRNVKGNNGIDYLLIVKKSNTTNMTLGMLIPEDRIMRPILTIRNWIWIILLSSVALAFFFSLYTFRRLLRPVHRLVDAMELVSKGNLKVQLTYEEQNEFGFMSLQFNRMVQQIDTLINEVYLQQLNEQRSQLKLLQSQINPHFLNNCLSFIYQTAMGGNQENAAEMALHLGRYFRTSMKLNHDFSVIGEEMTDIETYMRIQKMRFPDKFVYQIDIPEDLLVVGIPRLIIQPIVENAFVHGIEEVEGNHRKLIRISAKTTQDKLIIDIENNGKNISDERYAHIQGMLSSDAIENINNGLSNVHMRLKLTYGNDAGIRVTRLTAGGTLVSIVIPYS